MKKHTRVTLSLLALLSAGSASSQCISGIWDLKPIWVRDCTTDGFDGRYLEGAVATVKVSGEMPMTIAGVTRTLSWRLHWWRNKLAAAPALRDSVPLILGLHSWQDVNTIDVLLDNESKMMGGEGSWEDVIFLTVALENGYNLNTWWWGNKVGETPSPWVEEAILSVLKERIKDACSRLATAGAPELLGKAVDMNRIYLHGHSMGGTGAYRMGIKHPEIFAAIHAHAGFADFIGPCGNENFCTHFEDRLVGTETQHLPVPGVDGKIYPARDYTDMSWFIGSHLGSSWTAALGSGRKYEPPYIVMTHGKADKAVNIAAANRLFEVLKARRQGFTYYRHAGEHSDANFVRWNRLSNFRRNQSFLALTQNSTDKIGTADEFNFLDRLGWIPSSIVDKTNQYEVDLKGTGTADITLRRLQAFVVAPKAAYRFWLGAKTGDGTVVAADDQGVLTLPAVTVSGSAHLIVEPTVAATRKSADFGRVQVLPGEGSTLRLPAAWVDAGQGSFLEVLDPRGKVVSRLDWAPAQSGSGHGPALWSVPGIQSGAYFLRGRIGSLRISRPWSVLNPGP